MDQNKEELDKKNVEVKSLSNLEKKLIDTHSQKEENPPVVLPTSIKGGK